MKPSDIVGFLRQPENYPERPSRVELIETHFAWVFLTDLHAYKLKKPLRTAFLDYRTTAARRRGCRDELVLNRRLAPTVYLDVMPIVRNYDGALSLGERAGSKVVDWVVKMRRLPAGRMLDRAIADGSVCKSDLTAVASMLIRFFDGAMRQPLEAGRYLSKNRELVGTRSAALIEGHGDLRPEHIYLGSASDAPCVIDCLEFDSKLRWLDPAEEMAFLALECDKLGASEVARTLVSEYRWATLLPPAPTLIDFYMSQGALTRAKLAAWHVRDPEFAPRAAEWRARALSYLAEGARKIAQALRMSQANTAISCCDSRQSQASDRATAPVDAQPASVAPPRRRAARSKVS